MTFHLADESAFLFDAGQTTMSGITIRDSYMGGLESVGNVDNVSVSHSYFYGREGFNGGIANLSIDGLRHHPDTLANLRNYMSTVTQEELRLLWGQIKTPIVDVG